MEFTWNQALYEEIIGCTECLAHKCDDSRIFDVTSERYEPLITVEEESYLTHPDGPYAGTRDEMKHDLNYLSKKLILNGRKVPFSGRAIQAAIDDAARAGGGVVVGPEGLY